MKLHYLNKLYIKPIFFIDGRQCSDVVELSLLIIGILQDRLSL